MEYIIEFIFELLFEGSLEISKNKKVPKYIRYPLIVIILIFFILVIGLILLTGILSLKENIIIGLLFIIIGLLLLTLSIIKFIKIYLKRK